MADQAMTIKTYVKAGKTTTEAYNLLKEAYGDQVLSRSRVFKWHCQFKEGQEDAQSRGGKATPRLAWAEENIELIRTLINEDRLKTIQELLSEFWINAFTIHSILHEDLQLSEKSARWAPPPPQF